MHQKRTGPETMPAYTHKHGELKTNTRTDKRRPTTQRWVFGPPEFSCLPVADSPYRIASTVHQTWGRERNFLSPRIGCLPAHPLALALCHLAPLYRRFSHGLGCLPARLLASALRRLAPPRYRGFSSAPDTFLLPSRALDLHWTFLFCLSTGVFIYSSPLSWECSLSPVKGSWTSPQMFCPMSESLSRKREGFQDNAIHKKGSLLLT